MLVNSFIPRHILLELPQHLDSVDDTNISVVEVV